MCKLSDNLGLASFIILLIDLRQECLVGYISTFLLAI